MLLVLLLPAQARAERVGEAVDMMGTRVSVELWSEDEAGGRRLVETVLDEYRRIDAEMSTYRADSRLSRINARAAAGPVAVGPELIGLLDEALALSSLSDGAFDVTYESVGYLYDFRARQRPDQQRIEEHLPAIDYRHVVVDAAAGTVRFTRPG